MKNSKAILLAIFASVFAVLTVVNMSLASPKSAGENTLDILEIMTRAFDESEGGGSGPCPTFGDVSYGGYQATGIRSSSSGTDWSFSATVNGVFQLKVFPSFQAAQNRALELGLTVTITNDKWVEYNCDGSNQNICWVCNRYPLNGPGDPS